MRLIAYTSDPLLVAKLISKGWHHRYSEGSELALSWPLETRGWPEDPREEEPE